LAQLHILHGSIRDTRESSAAFFQYRLRRLDVDWLLLYGLSGNNNLSRKLRQRLYHILFCRDDQHYGRHFGDNSVLEKMRGLLTYSYSILCIE